MNKDDKILAKMRDRVQSYTGVNIESNEAMFNLYKELQELGEKF